VANDEARALLARGKKQARSFKQAVERAAGGRIDWNARVDMAAVRASIRRARVEDEVEKRVAAQSSQRMLRDAEVRKMTGLGRTTIWQLERRGLFPKRVRPLGTRAVRWHKSEVRRWIAERTARGTS